MSERRLFMPDKIMRSGSAPIFDDQNQPIATIHYSYFSMTRRIEITNTNGEVIGKGKMKAFSFRPTWIMLDPNDHETGMIKQHISFLSRRFTYTNTYGEEYAIDGNLRARNFRMTKNGELAISVSSTSDFFTMHPHSYAVQIYDDSIATSEAMNIVEGIRTLVEEDQSN